MLASSVNFATTSFFCKGQIQPCVGLDGEIQSLYWKKLFLLPAVCLSVTLPVHFSNSFTLFSPECIPLLPSPSPAIRNEVESVVGWILYAA